MKILLSLILLATTSYGEVAGPITLRLEVAHEYVDSKGNESDSRLMASHAVMLLSVWVQGGAVVRSQLTLGAKNTGQSGVILADSSVRDTELYQDVTGRIWLKQFRLSGTALVYALGRFIENDLTRLPISFNVVAVDQASVPAFSTLTFDTEFLGDGAYASNSNFIYFAGRRVDGVGFRASVVARQTQLKGTNP